MKRVVITGMGTVNPLGKNVAEFWENVKANKLGINPIDEFDTSDIPIKVVGSVKDFDPSGVIEKKEARRMDRFTQFAVCSAKEALNDAGTDFSDIDPYRAGVIVGAGIGGLHETEKQHSNFLEKGPDRISVFYIPMMITNMAAGTIAMKTGFKGDNFCTTTACASATHAIGEAFRKVKDGYLDVCLAGGTEACVTKFAVSGFNNMKALSKAEKPEEASTPFDANRQGFVLGEGCGILVLEELEHALARGAKIYAEIGGYGATGDAYHMTSPSPTGEAAARAMVNSFEEAGLTASDIGYINAHGTSTGLNDKYETTAIKLALGDSAKDTVVNSTKSMIGHLLGAAGAVEAIITALSVRDGFIHKTLGYKTFDPECDLNYATESNIQKEIKGALSNSLGFGGHNATICIKKYKA